MDMYETVLLIIGICCFLAFGVLGLRIGNCKHKYVIISSGRYLDDDPNDPTSLTWYNQQCTHCGNIRRVKI